MARRVGKEQQASIAQTLRLSDSQADFQNKQSEMARVRVRGYLALILTLANTDVIGTYQQTGLPSRRPSTTQARRPPSAVPTGKALQNQPRKDPL